MSGFNITIVAGLLAQTLGRLLGKRRAIYPVAAGIVLYTLLVGADAGVVRAAIMGILYVMAIHLGRQSTAFVSLSFSAMVMTAANPLTLWDVGFQLSFLSTLGMILFSSAMYSGLQRLLGQSQQPDEPQPVMRFLNDTLISTLAAQILTAPLVAASFGRLSLVSLLSNLLILPVQPLVLIWGGIATLAGLVWLPLGRVIAALPWLFLSYTTAVVEWTARLPYASLDVGALSQPLVWVFYALLLGGVGWRLLQARLETPIALPVRRALSLALVAMVPLWMAAAALNSQPDGRLHVWFIGLGDSDAVLLQTPAGRRVLVGVGSGETDIAARLQTTLPGWSRRLDLLVLTQGDAAHTNSVPEVLDRFRVTRLLLPEGVPHPQEAEQDSTSAGVPVMSRMTTGTQVQLGDGVLLEVLHAPWGTGDNSAVLRLSYGRLRVLLPSEIEQETQAQLLAGGLDLGATVLKAPHRGTGNWPADGFLVAVHPQIALVPNDTTYPPDVQDRLRALSTVAVDPLEIVEVISDGSQLWMRRHSSLILWPR